MCGIDNVIVSINMTFTFEDISGLTIMHLFVSQFILFVSCL